MNKFYFAILLSLSFHVSGQIKNVALKNAGLDLFGGKLFCYGFDSTSKNHFKIYTLNTSLQITDSLIIPDLKGSAGDYLPAYSDSLHECLNVYLQLKDQNSVNILRISNDFKLKEKILNVEIARLNNTAMFTGRKYHFNDKVYDIRQKLDSTGNQFFLNKYVLKKMPGNFDYEFKWQFPFEKKDIEMVRIVHANDRYVTVYVRRNAAGQYSNWLVQVNSNSGHLIRATRIKTKTENVNFELSNCRYNTKKQTLFLTGQKVTAADYESIKNGIVAKTNSLIALWVAIQDTTGEVNVQDFNVPVNVNVSGAKKLSSHTFLRIDKITFENNGGYSLETDIFRRLQNEKCYQYINSVRLELITTEESLALKPANISANPEIEFFNSTKDRLDLNGKICIEKSNFDDAFITNLIFPTKKVMHIDSQGNLKWVIQKSETRKNQITFATLKLSGKNYKTEEFLKADKNTRPTLFSPEGEKIIMGQQTNSGNYKIELLIW